MLPGSLTQTLKIHRLEAENFFELWSYYGNHFVPWSNYAIVWFATFDYGGKPELILWFYKTPEFISALMKNFLEKFFFSCFAICREYSLPLPPEMYI